MENLINLPVLETLQNVAGHAPPVSDMGIFNGQERVDKARKLYGQLGGNELVDMMNTNEIKRLLKEEIDEWRDTLSTTPVLSESQTEELMGLAQFLEEVNNDDVIDVEFSAPSPSPPH